MRYVTASPELKSMMLGLHDGEAVRTINGKVVRLVRTMHERMTLDGPVKVAGMHSWIDGKRVNRKALFIHCAA